MILDHAIERISRSLWECYEIMLENDDPDDANRREKAYEAIALCQQIIDARPEGLGNVEQAYHDVILKSSALFEQITRREK